MFSVLNQKMHIQNIPEANPKKRLVIVGAGFAGLRLLRKVSHDGLQIVLLDRNNFHQFQPLLYQVATSGLEPSAISFPIRKILQKENDGNFLNTSDGKRLGSKTLIWVAGVQANHVKGLAKEVFGRGNRIMVDKTNRVGGHENIFVLGDLALMQTDHYPYGHPQVAQVAIQQADRLAKNLKQQNNGTPLKLFEYCDKGSMATIGRNLAVADLPFTKLMGFAAWILWSFVHLFTIMGVKNRLFIFLNWSWGYFTYDQSLRVLIRPRQPHKTVTKESEAQSRISLKSVKRL